LILHRQRRKLHRSELEVRSWKLEVKCPNTERIFLKQSVQNLQLPTSNSQYNEMTCSISNYWDYAIVGVSFKITHLFSDPTPTIGFSTVANIYQKLSEDRLLVSVS